ncbi:MAG: GH36-type glycosyl hydrolase domain-containing protein [Oscillospiraceae bacterium]|jgi:cyclic beta-1,2-glucan synthetase
MKAILTEEQQSQFAAYASSFRSIRLKPVKPLKRELDRAMAFLRRERSRAGREEHSSNSSESLINHYFLLEKMAREATRNLKGTLLPQFQDEPDLFAYLSQVYAKDELAISTASLMEAVRIFQKQRYLTNAEHDFVKTALQIFIIRRAADIIANREPIETLEACFAQIYALETVDFDALLNAENHLENLLKKDPTGVYSKMDKQTRHQYRYMVSRLSTLQHTDESELAEGFLQQAKEAEGNTDAVHHVGFYIYRDYHRVFHPHILKALYMPLLFLSPAVISLAFALVFHRFWLPILLYIPCYEICKSLIDALFSSCLKGEYAPRMRVTEALLDENKTLLVLSTMIASMEDVKPLSIRLEDLFYKTSSNNIGICVLADLKAAEFPELLEDQAVLSALKQEIIRLNETYGSHFTVLVRPRRYSKTQENYSGFDRKRGAICELTRYICGEEVTFYLAEGNFAFLRECKYMVALDSDTVPLLETVPELVSIAAHPLNKPVVDEGRGIVVSGYGIFVPQISSDLKSVQRTPFAKIMGGQGGIHAYDPVSPDIYQDLYHESIFAGKGLIDIHLFYRLACNLFEDETVLSHDILEGSLLRTRYIPDVEFLDSFPPTAISYFKRQHRWMRGDAQNIGFIGRTIDTKMGRRRNPLNTLSRIKLFDNLRRALTPFFAILCLLAAFFISYAPLRIALISTAFLTAAAPFLIGILSSFLFSGFASFTSRYYSGALPVCGELLLKMIFHVVFLAHNAYLGIDAVIRALYRRWISRKNLLEWTTAAQGERAKSTVGGLIRHFFASEVLGVFLLLSPFGSLRLFGICFFVAFLVAAISSEPYPEKNSQLDDAVKDRLIAEMARMFHFYQVYANRSEHYLPPDNVQFAPVYRIAHRTSPTNIGYMMLSVLCARDCGIIGNDSMIEFLEHTTDTLERLEKWHGNLYNWYDTRTLTVLQPAFVSTVDSGNFVCALVALKEGLKEYEAANIRVTKLIDRLIGLIEATDLSPFYDHKKELFSIGYDSSANALSQSHYDMLMSEARMTSFFAIAKKMVPVSHWGALSRRLSRLHSYKGPVSWTGTMFEYFMPELFLSCEKGSLGYEALRFCLHVQKNHAAKMGLPFGISESAIYSFDQNLNYQYKANGVQKIALKSHMNADVVLSPYSTYLALPFQPHAALKNLNALKKLGTFGRFGHYEAVDFTPKRVGDSPYEMIKSYMAHHIGMSILAVNNAVNSGVLQKRFLADREMRSAKELLQEKITNGTDLFQEQYTEHNSRPNEKELNEQMIYTKVYPHRPRVKVLSNQELTGVYTDSGVELMLYRGNEIIRRTSDLLKKPNGFFALLKTPQKIIGLTSAPLYGAEDSREVLFGDDSVRYITRTADVKTELSAQISRSMPCEVKTIRINNRRSRHIDCELLLYLEPALASWSDDAAHPAFSKLFVDIGYQPSTGIITAKRKSRMGEDSLYLAAGFLEDLEFSMEFNRERVLRSPEGIFSLSDAFQQNFNGEDGAIPDPCVAVKTKLNLPQHASKEVHFVLSVGQTAEQAADGIIGLRGSRRERNELAAITPLMHHTAEGRLADTVLPQILFQKRLNNKTLEAIAQNKLPRETIWEYGISGDYPILLVELAGENDSDRARNYVRLHTALKKVGILSDLILLFAGDGEKANLVAEMVDDAMLSESGGGNMADRQHIRFVDITKEPDEIGTFFRALACHIASLSMTAINLPSDDYTPILLQAVRPAELPPDPDVEVVKGAFSNDSFFAESDTQLPWSHILANDVFGTLATNKSLGYTWAVNSRENKLTPWSNDTMSDHQGEYLILRIGNDYYNLCDGALAEFNPHFVRYCGMAGSLSYRVTVSIDPEYAEKRLSFCCRNHGEKPIEAEIAYYVQPISGVDGYWARFNCAEMNQQGCKITSAFAVIPGSALCISASTTKAHCCFDRVDFFSGRWEETRQSLPNNDPCAAVIQPVSLPPQGEQSCEFTLIFQVNNKTLAAQKAERPCNRLQIHTPAPELDALFNTWLPYQAEYARMTARTGFYQCGGAYGFRDQLQDACTVLLWNPDKVRGHILRACAHQFPEGDVLHWWHELPESAGGTKGVRTRCSDDLVWLPYAVCEYLKRTGNNDVLNESVAYLAGEPLAEGEQERYQQITPSDESGTVYEHCLRALEHAYRLGKHGLPLIGNGDWNDGLNHIGTRGIGESIWLAQFLSLVMHRFSGICAHEHDFSQEKRLQERARQLRQAVEDCAWDGAWYQRAFTDDGAVLGSKDSPENRIDSLPQSFSVFAGLDPTRSNMALESAYQYLVDEKYGIIKLFDRPFTGKSGRVGYIQSYPEGVRENGGQYTHAAVWLTMATLLAGDAENGWNMVKMLNPVNHCKTSEEALRYLTEPYYLAGDVYANPKQYARGGWSIYTGAAAWYYRCILESLLGLDCCHGFITLSPHLPSGWDEWSAELEYQNTIIHLTAKKGDAPSLLVNGEVMEKIPCDGHEKTVQLIYA